MSLILLQSVDEPFIARDMAGRVLPFATLDFYVSGTDELADDLPDGPNYAADIDGEFPLIPVVLTTAYRVIHKTADGVLVYDVDPYVCTCSVAPEDTAGVFRSPIQRAFDIDGVISPGALLFSTDDDTGDPTPLYADAALERPLSNPIVANAAGAFPLAIYSDDDVTYLLNLNDAGNDPIAQYAPYECVCQTSTPVIDSLDPDTVLEDLGALTLTVTGSNFIADSVVRWAGSDRVTTFVSSTELTAAILAADVDDAGSFDVTVFNIGGGGLSNAEPFVVTAAAVYAVFDAATAGANIALSGGNLTATRSGSGTWQSVRATISKSSGKWYWEYVITTVQENDVILGAADSTQSASNYVGSNLGGYGVQSADAANAVLKYHNGSAGAFASAPTRRWQQNDVIMVALDADNDMIWFGFNGNWALEGGAPPNPATQTGPSFTVVTAALFGAVSMFSAQSVTANFGATPLAYSPPSGFNAGLYT